MVVDSEGPTHSFNGTEKVDGLNRLQVPLDEAKKLRGDVSRLQVSSTSEVPLRVVGKQVRGNSIREAVAGTSCSRTGTCRRPTPSWSRSTTQRQDALAPPGKPLRNTGGRPTWHGCSRLRRTLLQD